MSSSSTSEWNEYAIALVAIEVVTRMRKCSIDFYWLAKSDLDSISSELFSVLRNCESYRIECFSSAGPSTS